MRSRNMVALLSTLVFVAPALGAQGGGKPAATTAPSKMMADSGKKAMGKGKHAARKGMAKDTTKKDAVKKP